MSKAINVLTVLVLWYLKSTNLPSLYHIKKRRGAATWFYTVEWCSPGAAARRRRATGTCTRWCRLCWPRLEAATCQDATSHAIVPNKRIKNYVMAFIAYTAMYNKLKPPKSTKNNFNQMFENILLCDIFFNVFCRFL